MLYLFFGTCSLSETIVPRAQFGSLHAKDVNKEMVNTFNSKEYVLEFAHDEACSKKPLTRKRMRELRRILWTGDPSLSKDVSCLVRGRFRRLFGGVRVPPMIPSWERMQVRMGGIVDSTDGGVF